MKVGEAFVEVRADTSKFGPELSKGVESVRASRPRPG